MGENEPLRWESLQGSKGWNLAEMAEGPGIVEWVLTPECELEMLINEIVFFLLVKGLKQIRKANLILAW